MPEATAAWQRLHPLSPLFAGLRSIATMAIPLLIVVFAGGERWEFYATLIVGFGFVSELIQYRFTRYRMDQEQLIVRRGVFMRQERFVPFARIQNIDLVQNPLHRLFGVAEVRVETASGSEPEAVLRVLGLEAVARMREGIFGHGGAGAEAVDGREAESPETLLHHCPLDELALLGAFSNRGLLIAGAGAAFLWQFPPLRERIPGQVEAAGDVVTPLLAFALLLAAVPILIVLAVVWTLIAFYDFRLLCLGDDLRLSCGLLRHMTSTVPRRHIQFLSLQSNPLHRRLGRCTLRIETAGGSLVQEGGSLTRRWFLPIARQEEALNVLMRIQDRLDLRMVDWQPLGSRARKRLLLKASWKALACAALALLWGGSDWALAVLALGLPLFIGHAWLLGRSMAWAEQAQGVFFRSGVWTHKLSATFFAKIQVLSLHQSPFDRRWDMASLVVDTAGAGPARHRIAVPYLDQAQAGELLQRWSSAAEAEPFHW